MQDLGNSSISHRKSETEDELLTNYETEVADTNSDKMTTVIILNRTLTIDKLEN